MFLFKDFLKKISLITLPGLMEVQHIINAILIIMSNYQDEKNIRNSLKSH
jgi:hypothetical protein